MSKRAKDCLSGIGHLFLRADLLCPLPDPADLHDHSQHLHTCVPMLQAMLEHGSRNLVDLGAAAGHCISSQQPSAAGNLEFLLLTDGNRSALKLAASVVRLQRKLASR